MEFTRWLVNKTFIRRLYYIHQAFEHATLSFKNKKKQNIELDSFDKKYKTGFYLQALAFKNLLQKNEKKWPVQNLKDVLKTYYLIKKIFKDD